MGIDGPESRCAVSFKEPKGELTHMNKIEQTDELIELWDENKEQKEQESIARAKKKASENSSEGKVLKGIEQGAQVDDLCVVYGVERGVLW